MAIPSNKAELKEAIRTNYQKLRSELDGIPAALAREKELEGHAKNTRMSVCDLLAYLNGWGQLVLKWNDKKSKGEKVDLPETGYKWNELGKLAQKFYADHAARSYPQLQKELDATVAAIISLVESRSNRQLYETAWYEQWTMGRLIQLNTSSPYSNARLRLRKWKKGRGLA